MFVVRLIRFGFNYLRKLKMENGELKMMKGFDLRVLNIIFKR